MRIEILCGGGSPDGVHLSDIYGQNGRVGIGGAELGLLTLCQGWANQGHEVILYNNPRRQDGVFEQRPVVDFDRVDKRGDVVIFFRVPNERAVSLKALKVFFSCDQFTAGDFKHFSQFVDKVVTISPFHSRYFHSHYDIKNSIDIDLPVRLQDYDTSFEEKVPNRLIFTTVPDRGLGIVAQTFPHIKKQIPDASLVITSDYRLWGVGSPLNQQFVSMFLRMEGVEFLGAVPRDRLIREQLKAQILHYPFNGQTEELFCIAAAESQVAGTLPITSSAGALGTTNMGVQIDGDANSSVVQQIFVQKTVEYLTNPNLPQIQKDLQIKARERFSLDRILGEWEEKVFK